MSKGGETARGNPTPNARAKLRQDLFHLEPNSHVGSSWLHSQTSSLHEGTPYIYNFLNFLLAHERELAMAADYVFHTSARVFCSMSVHDFWYVDTYFEHVRACLITCERAFFFWAWWHAVLTCPRRFSAGLHVAGGFVQAPCSLVEALLSELPD